MSSRKKASDQVDNDRAIPGDNSGEEPDIKVLSEEEFLNIVSNIFSCEAKKDTAVANVRNARKLGDEAGLDLKIFDKAIRLRNMTPEEIIFELKTMKAYGQFLRIRGLDIIGNVEIEPTSDDDNLGHALGAGKLAARLGEKSDTNPHTLDTPMGREWQTGYHAEQERMIKAGIKKKR